MAKRPARTKTTGKSASAAETPPTSAGDAGEGAGAAPGEGRGGRGGGRTGGRTGGQVGGRGKRGGRVYASAYTAGAAKGKNLVIVESPSKAKTINKYLGKDFLVLASVGHVRDLPSKNPKGVKSPVPGVDLEKGFRPTYVISEGKEKVIGDLKRAAKESRGSGKEVWFATDLDREGEAIAWHLAEELGIKPAEARRVIFAAITKAEIERAFSNPHPIDVDRVNAQQARRILDRIVGYQVSPLLWKKVARGLSAGRVQSVAVRLVVDREREIRAFVPDEYWSITGHFTAEAAKAAGLVKAWSEFLAQRDEKGQGPGLKAQGAFLAECGGFAAELVEVGGEKFDLKLEAQNGIGSGVGEAAGRALAERCAQVAKAAGLVDAKVSVKESPEARGSARWVRTVRGAVDPTVRYAVTSIETRRTTTRPPPPFITSTLQQAAANRLGFGAQRTMRAAQQLYEGVEIPGEGPVGLITYMRTDSTHLSREALEMARGYVGRQFGEKYLPEKPNFFSSSNKDAQEAHEAIRPTVVELSPSSSKIRAALSSDQFKLYTLIWERFVACQMTPAQWDSTAVMLRGGRDASMPVTFRATGRVLVFDGFYKVAGVPRSGEEQTLPVLREGAEARAFSIEAEQKFTSPPPRYTEASLIKMLESEGIGRPSTYASIIETIQDRKYVEQIERRFYATHLGEVVTDKLLEAIPGIMDVGYTREMEAQLDKVEEDHLDWIEMLRKFYGPFKASLANAEATLVHAKAEVSPAPEAYRCPTCGSGLVYRFGKNGRFLSCSTYPTCNWAGPCDRDGKPLPAAETVDVACPKCGAGMTKRVGRFGPFLGCSRYGDKQNPCDGILNLDKKGRVVAPSPKPYSTALPCPSCEAPLYLRGGARGPWLSCSRFPKCRGRGKWAEVPQEKQQELLKAMESHERANPAVVIRSMTGKALTDAHGKPLPDAMPVGTTPDEPATLEAVADELGV